MQNVKDKLRSSKKANIVNSIQLKNRDIILIYGNDENKVHIIYDNNVLCENINIENINDVFINSLPYKLVDINMEMCYKTFPCKHECKWENINGEIHEGSLFSDVIVKLYKRFDQKIPEHFHAS